MLGRAPVVDFDGTLADLAVPWADLRRLLGIERISDLWSDPAADWDLIRRAEEAAAEIATPRAATLDQLGGVERFAILSDNSERAVWRFVERFDLLAPRVAVVIGRETLAGPKTEFDHFASGYAACVESTADARGDEVVVYVGDQAYELDFAARLGARALHVGDLAPSR